MSDMAARLREVRQGIAGIARDFERAADSVRLIAVSKTKPVEEIEPALAAGQVDFGENYVQEAQAKWPELKARYPQTRLHMIGPLQSNKAKEAVALFDAIHSLDRESLARELSKEIAKAGQEPELLVQVNTGEEPQKGGVAPQELDGFLSLCRDRYGLKISGLMCIPPAEDQPSPHFALLAKLAKRHGLDGLSMGMSADYEAAIQLGATYVRVGSAIFGARN